MTADSRTIVPALLQESTANHLTAFSEVASIPAPLAGELPRLFAMSDFVAQSCVRQPDLMAGLVDSGDLFASYTAEGHAARLAAALAGCTEENDLAARLRRFRRREMVRIAWRDLSGRAEFVETAADLSSLADACIEGALRVIEELHQAQFGVPYGSDGERLRLVVFGMGKLGGRELNYSSDVDLIFSYAGEGETRDGPRTISHQEYFIRLGQRLIAAIDRVTADGFVFRVDMRLRPFGEASALAISFEAMEDYYQVHGREWERYAMIKARAVAGDVAAGERLLQELKPFVYRRYVDFGAFESLREMKAMIEAEMRRKGMGENVKLGQGGIREVEFIAQAFQLIRGGREPRLQGRSLLPVLAALGELSLLPDYVVEELRRGYIFLRDTENAIQMAADQQTQLLPTHEAGRARLAFAMGFDEWDGFLAALNEQRELVHQHFEQVFAAPQRDGGPAAGTGLDALWLGTLSGEAALALLAASGYGDPAEALRLIEQTRGGHAVQALSPRGRQRLDGLMPLLIGAVGQRPDPDVTLKHLIQLVEAIARRTAYLALLVENPMALSQLVRLCSASPWIASLLTLHPVVLDELLDPRSLYHPPRRTALAQELRGRLQHVDPQDEEQQLEALRHFKQSNVLRVAAADVVGAVPLMVVSDHLTEIAEVVLYEALELAWRHLVARHGTPAGAGEGKGFAVFAYGKLGGIELGYGSDLDLVFLHTDAEGVTGGERPVDNAVFYARLAQRLIHILNTRTASGVLYEVDTRLRPSGASGLLVSTLAAFSEYQRHQAWTWEHQALVRARMVAGDAAVGAVFDGLRREVLGRERELAALREEVRVMRERMRASLSKAQAGQFDLKQDPGGIADIEFMVQYGVLAWAHAHPDLLEFTDNIRQLEGLARNGILTPADAGLLADAYRAYRARLHRLTLRGLPALVPDHEFAELRAGVQRLWRQMMETN
jgi:glutamate-ammonia-ligase adenylyltransferase